MKKKGFTLVELLAVIAILAILVIIALPNVIGLFQSAQKNSFVNEVKEVYRQANNQWLLDGMASGAGKTYSTGNNCTKLELSGRATDSTFVYKVVVGNDGKITTLMVSDGKNHYSQTVSTGEIKITDITNNNLVTTAPTIGSC